MIVMIEKNSGPMIDAQSSITCNRLLIEGRFSESTVSGKKARNVGVCTQSRAVIHNAAITISGMLGLAVISIKHNETATVIFSRSTAINMIFLSTLSASHPPMGEKKALGI